MILTRRRRRRLVFSSASRTSCAPVSSACGCATGVIGTSGFPELRPCRRNLVRISQAVLKVGDWAASAAPARRRISRSTEWRMQRTARRGVRRLHHGPTPAQTWVAALRERGPAIAGFVLPFALVLYLGLKGGGYDLVVYSEVGIAIWWIVLLGALVAVLPSASIPRAGLGRPRPDRRVRGLDRARRSAGRRAPSAAPPSSAGSRPTSASSRSRSRSPAARGCGARSTRWRRRSP